MFMYIPLTHCLSHVTHNFMKMKFTKMPLPQGFLNCSGIVTKMTAAAPDSVL